MEPASALEDGKQLAFSERGGSATDVFRIVGLEFFDCPFSRQLSDHVTTGAYKLF